MGNEKVSFDLVLRSSLVSLWAFSRFLAYGHRIFSQAGRLNFELRLSLLIGLIVTRKIPKFELELIYLYRYIHIAKKNLCFKMRTFSWQINILVRVRLFRLKLSRVFSNLSMDKISAESSGSQKILYP
jgi:hypothetical protein